MAAKLDIPVDNGADLNFMVQWGTEVDGVFEARDLTGHNITIELYTPGSFHTRCSHTLDVDGTTDIWIRLPAAFTDAMPAKLGYIVKSVTVSEVAHVVEGYLVSKHATEAGGDWCGALGG